MSWAACRSRSRSGRKSELILQSTFADIEDFYETIVTIMALPIFDIDGMLVKHNGYKIDKAG